MGPFGPLKSPKAGRGVKAREVLRNNAPKRRPKTPQGPQMTPQGSQNDPQRLPKWSPKLQKMTPEGPWKGPKGPQDTPKIDVLSVWNHFLDPVGDFGRVASSDL